ncbi:hypothetical protein CBR_g40435 [Chara braunii]|uniref:DUF952 domain-containing protein n=1 Tax=Chara braunii TaxID=69332 RepID=A0A388LTR2_CHABU|nr:hypothetical protein CBR_g40435 [Chara braunii]|eukprot:GBG85706.1 hypothetical protein CBR_g40435 [Chara braunii]
MESLSTATVVADSEKDAVPVTDPGTESGPVVGPGSEVGAKGPGHIYKISTATEWGKIQAEGRISFDGDSATELDRKSGFIHLSTFKQLAGTLKLFFAGRSDLYLLKVNTDKIDGPKLKYEGSAFVPSALFPHYYGDIHVAAIDEATSLIVDEFLLKNVDG